jgi:uncharacterized DUF497 family protein
VYIGELEWDERNEEHIARHGVSVGEVIEVIEGRSHARKHRGRYLVFGRTGAGRYLLIVLVHKGRGCWRVITSRDMTDAERRHLGRQLGD